MILVAHVYVIHPLSFETEVLLLTSGKHFTSGGQNYIPAIKTPITYGQSLFSRGTTSGETTVGVGELVIQNIDERFDYLRTYGFDGQRVDIYLLDDENDTLSDSKLYYRGTAFYAEITAEAVTITLMSRLQEMDIPCIEQTFEGTNAGPTGLEGTEETIKGKQKPMVYGRCFNIPLYCLNSSALIYGCNFNRDGTRKAVKYFKYVRDKGGELLFEADVASASLLQAASVTAGMYKSCIAEGLVKLGSVPQGDVTADVYESDGEDSSAPRVARRMLEELKGYAGGADFNTDELNSLHDKNACPVGIFITDSTTVLSAVTQVLDSIAGWMIPDSKGFLRFGRIEDPATLPVVATITEDMYLDGTLNRIPTNDDARNIPAFKLELKHTRNWEPMSKGELLISLAEEIAGALREEYRSVVSEDSAVKTVHPNATYLTYETLLMKPLQAKVRSGDCTTNKNGDFVGTQESGTGGSVAFSGQMTINPGTGNYYVTQTLSSPDEIYPGNHVLYFELVSGTVEARVTQGVTTLASTTFTGAGTKSLAFTMPIGSGVVIMFRVTSGGGSAVIDNIFVYESNPGLTVQQEADRRFAIQKKTQERFTLELDFLQFSFIEVGQAIILQDQRFGLEAGKSFLVIGRDDDLEDEKLELDIWSINES